MITDEQVEAALKAWYDAGDAGNFASMFAALKAADLASAARIAELERQLACSIVSGNDAHEQALGYVYELNDAAARIAELEAAIDLFIAYDETDDEAMVAMVQCYDAAIEAARKVRGK